MRGSIENKRRFTRTSTLIIKGRSNQNENEIDKTDGIEHNFVTLERVEEEFTEAKVNFDELENKDLESHSAPTIDS